MAKSQNTGWVKPDNESSNIAFIKWDNVKVNTLSVEFSKGGKYKYAGVSKEIFKEFKAASSAGKYFHENIKDKYETTKL